MNTNRDPFNLRRKSPASQLFRSTSNSSIHQESPSTRTTNNPLLSIDTNTTHSSHGAHTIAPTMSGYGIPHVGAASHSVEGWQSSGRSRFQHSNHSDSSTNPGLSEKVGDTIGGMFRDGRKESLPMYKDKPSNFYGAGGRNARQWMRRKRTLGGVLGVFALLSWWFGILSPLSWITGGSEEKSTTSTSSKTKGWGLFSGTEPVNWDDRAQRVKEAFQISWSGYEKYGWGMYRDTVCPGGSMGEMANAERAQGTTNIILSAILGNS